MNTLNRIKNIVRSQKASATKSFGGDIMAELQKHLATLDERVSTVSVAQTMARIEKESWAGMLKTLQKKIQSEPDGKKAQSLSRLADIASANISVVSENLNAYQEKNAELAEIRKRVVQAIGMIEVENNIRSVTSMYDGQKGFESLTINLELETREIRRLLYTTDGLMEIAS